ncbi:MAG: alpha/beta fold hydrolase [Candidatus Hydrogenedentes bacterium]|nr:alpha/beta fold hydrolase [Candidatus Hydrogenedentota bacterium]
MLYIVLTAILLALALAAYPLLRHCATACRFDSDGVRIRYWDEGHGTPVILVHGFAIDALFNWRAPGVIRALRRHYRVISFDLRGHGGSDKPMTMDAYGTQMADDILRLMDHLKIVKAHVLGYSMGGFITMDLVGRHPDRLLSACIGGAGWFPEGEYPEILQTLPASLDAGTGHMPIIQWLEANHGPLLDLRQRIANRIICFYNPNCAAMARCFESLTALRGSEEDLRNNRVPVFSYVGTRDPLRIATDNLVGRASCLETLYIDGADHATTLALRPYRNQCLRGMLDFLERNTA